MNEEYIRELLRAQRERQSDALTRQQQQQQQNYNVNLQQLGLGLGASSTLSVSEMLSSSAGSPVDAAAAAGTSTAGQSVLDFVTSPRRASDYSAASHANLFNSGMLPSVAGASASPSAISTAGQSVLDFFASPRRASDYSAAAHYNSGMLPSIAGASASAAAAAAAATAGNEAQLSSLAISQEIKRLRELQQYLPSNSSPSTTNNPFLYASQRVQPSSSPAVNPNSAILQQYLLQKAQLPRFSPNASALSSRLTSSTGLPRVSNDAAHQAILESQLLLQEAQMLMRRQSMPTTFAAAAAAKTPAPFPSVASASAAPSTEGCRKMRGGVIEPFPEKLHRLLLEVERSGRSDVISFVSEGRAFVIHDSELFFREIVPLYFRQSRLSSFKRQLNLYGFELVNTGPSRGAYYHELFHRDHPERCRRMRRVAVKLSPPKPAASAAADHANEDDGH